MAANRLAPARQPVLQAAPPDSSHPTCPSAFPHAQWPRLPAQQDTCDSPPPHSRLQQRHQHDPSFARGETEAPKCHRAQNCASQDFSCILTLYHGSLSLWWPLEMCSWGPAFRPPPPQVPQPLPCTSLPRSGSGLQEHPLKWGTGSPAPFRVVTSVGATHRAASTQAHHQGAGCAWGYLVPLQEASRGEYMGRRWRCGFEQCPPQRVPPCPLSNGACVTRAACLCPLNMGLFWVTWVITINWPGPRCCVCGCWKSVPSSLQLCSICLTSCVVLGRQGQLGPDHSPAAMPRQPRPSSCFLPPGGSQVSIL